MPRHLSRRNPTPAPPAGAAAAAAGAAQVAYDAAEMAEEAAAVAGAAANNAAGAAPPRFNFRNNPLASLPSNPRYNFPHNPPNLFDFGPPSRAKMSKRAKLRPSIRGVKKGASLKKMLNKAAARMSRTRTNIRSGNIAATRRRSNLAARKAAAAAAAEMEARQEAARKGAAAAAADLEAYKAAVAVEMAQRAERAAELERRDAAIARHARDDPVGHAKIRGWQASIMGAMDRSRAAHEARLDAMPHGEGGRAAAAHQRALAEEAADARQRAEGVRRAEEYAAAGGVPFRNNPNVG